MPRWLSILAGRPDAFGPALIAGQVNRRSAGLSLPRSMRSRWALIVLAAALWAALPAAAPATGARRVVCMAPAFTEICFALGHGDAVAGVTDYCDFPDAARRLPRVGGFLNPNLEAIIRIAPDLVLLVPEEAELAQRLGALGIRAEVLSLYTLADIERAMRVVARRLGDPAAGEALARTWRRELQAVARERSAGAAPRVMVVVGRNPASLNNVFVAGPKTFLGELVQLAGGRNVYQGKVRYPSLSLEGIAHADPEVIVEMYPGMKLDAAQMAALARDWDRLPALAAVRSRRVHVLDDAYLAIPGPRAVAIARALRECMAGRGDPR